MELFDLPDEPVRSPQLRTHPSESEIDVVLTAQVIVGWAGERGEQKRLGWWRTDLAYEYGGEDLFRRLLPATWRWAVLQGAREAARRTDAELRRQAHDPDRILSLFSLDNAVDERCEERLRDLKRSGARPEEALPRLAHAIEGGWSTDRFLAWVRSHGDAETTVAPMGRRLAGEPPDHLEELVRRLVAGLAPLADAYPLPHFRRVG